MTLETVAIKKVHVGNGATTIFPYDFYIPDADSLKVYLTELATGTQTLISNSLYSATGLGTDAFGNITYPLMGSPISSAYSLTIAREREYKQTADITNQGGAYRTVVEGGLDNLAMLIQQLYDLMQRTTRVPLSETLTNLIPVKLVRKSKLAGYDANGDPTVSQSTIDEMDSVISGAFANYAGLNFPAALPTIASVAGVNGFVGGILLCVGHLALGDAPARIFFWNAAAAQQAGDAGENAVWVKPTAQDYATAGRWEVHWGGDVHAEWFGAKEGLADNAVPINLASAYVADRVGGKGGGNVLLGIGDFNIQTTVIFRQRTVIKGVNEGGTWVIGTTAGMTMFRAEGDPDGYVFYSGLENMFIHSNNIAIRGVNWSGCSYSTFKNVTVNLKGSSKVCWFAEGNTGSSPYYNAFYSCNALGDNTIASGTTSSIGWLFQGGGNTPPNGGGSSGPNGNDFFGNRRNAALSIAVDIRTGNGNKWFGGGAESIMTAHLRFNVNAVHMSGTATGGSLNTLEDTGRDFLTADTLRRGYAVRITSGTGAGQHARIASVATTVVTMQANWKAEDGKPGVAPDGSSVYSITSTQTIGGTADASGHAALTLVDSDKDFSNLGVVSGNQLFIASGTGAGQSMKVSGLSATVAELSGTATSGSATTLTDTGADFVTSEVQVGWAIVTTGGTGSGQTRAISVVAATVLTVGTAFSPAIDGTTTYEIRKYDTLIFNMPWLTVPAGDTVYTISEGRAVGNKVLGWRAEGASGAYMFDLHPGAHGNELEFDYESSLGGTNYRDRSPLQNRLPGKHFSFHFAAQSVAAGATTKLAPAIGSSISRGGVFFPNSFVIDYVVATCGGRTAGTATVKIYVGSTLRASGVFGAILTDRLVMPLDWSTPTETRSLYAEVTTDGSWAVSSQNDINVDVYGRVRI